MANLKAPHKGIVTMHIAMYESMKDGQLHPDPVDSRTIILTTQGKNAEECANNIDKKIHDMKAEWIKEIN